MASLTRHPGSHLLTTHIYPAWLPKALDFVERRTFIPNPQPKHQLPSFQFSACLQSLFSLQDSILGVENPLGFLQARAFSQSRRHRSITPSRAVVCGRSRSLTVGGQMGGEHTSKRPGEALSAGRIQFSVRMKERERLDRYRAMESRILSVL
jgi:hypothetical protein